MLNETYTESVRQLTEAVDGARRLTSKYGSSIRTQQDGENTGAITLGDQGGDFTVPGEDRKHIFTFGDNGMSEKIVYAQPIIIIAGVPRSGGEAPEPETTHFGQGEDAIGFIALATTRIHQAKRL